MSQYALAVVFAPSRAISAEEELVGILFVVVVGGEESVECSEMVSTCK